MQRGLVNLRQAGVWSRRREHLHGKLAWPRLCQQVHRIAHHDYQPRHHDIDHDHQPCPSAVTIDPQQPRFFARRLDHSPSTAPTCRAPLAWRRTTRARESAICPAEPAVPTTRRLLGKNRLDQGCRLARTSPAGPVDQLEPKRDATPSAAPMGFVCCDTKSCDDTSMHHLYSQARLFRSAQVQVARQLLPACGNF